MQTAQLRSLALKAAVALALLALIASAARVGPFSAEPTSSTGDPVSDASGPSSGSEDGATGAEGGGGGEPDAAPASDPALTGALLMPADLPAGWQLELRTEQSPQDSVCGREFDATEGGTATPKVFFSNAPSGDYLAQSIVGFSDGEAADTLDRLRGLLDGCGDWTTVQSDGSTQAWDLATIEFPTLGDDTVAFRLSGRVGELDLQTTQIVILRGNTLNTVAYVAGDSTRERIKPIAELADEKVRAALQG